MDQLEDKFEKNDIRPYIKRRKVSGSSYGELGRRHRATFTSSEKTRRKFGASPWEHFLCGFSKNYNIPSQQHTTPYPDPTNRDQYAIIDHKIS